MAKMRYTKEEYDNLYYYMNEHRLRMVEAERVSPLDLTSPRRYATIDECRMAALARSKKSWRVIRQTGPTPWDPSISYAVFKGTRYLGFVECDPNRPRGAAHEGFWYPVEHPKDPSPIYKDGSIGRRNRS